MPSANVIQNDPAIAYERWQPAHFGSAGAPGPEGYPTTQQVENIQEQAHREGFAAGMREGRERVNTEVAQLAALAGGLQTAIAELEESLAGGILDLCLEVSQRMLHTALNVRPELVLPLIRQALREFSAPGETRHIALHPADAQLAREQLAEPLASAGWKIVEDASIRRGGCRLTTGRGEIDAALDSRWRMIVATLGRNSDWLEQAEEVT